MRLILTLIACCGSLLRPFRLFCDPLCIMDDEFENFGLGDDDFGDVQDDGVGQEDQVEDDDGGDNTARGGRSSTADYQTTVTVKRITTATRRARAVAATSIEATLPTAASQPPGSSESSPSTSVLFMNRGEFNLVAVRHLFPLADDMSRPRVVNTICLLNLGVPVDLKQLAMGARNVEFIPKRRIVVLRVQEPPAAAIIRQGGLVTISGAASIAAAKRAACIVAKVVRAVLQLGDQLTKVTFRAMSVNVRFDLKHPIRLEALKVAHPEACAYDPESFCAAVLRLKGTSADGTGQPWYAVCSVFVSGKVNITGLRSAQDIDAAYNTLLPLLAEHAANRTLRPTAAEPPKVLQTA